MNVRELMAELQSMPADKEVQVYDAKTDENVTLERVYNDPDAVFLSLAL